MTRKLFLFALILILGLGVLFTENSRVRWFEDQCQWNTIHLQEGTIDLAIFGSSRSARAVHAIEIEKSAAKFISPNLVVYDFSRTQRGLGHSYIMIKELLSNRRVSKLMVEFNSTHNRIYHDLMYLKSGVLDLAVEYQSEQHKPALTRAAFVLSSFIRRVAKRWEQLLLGKIELKPWGKVDVVKAKSTDCVGPRNSIEPSVLLSAEKKQGDSWFSEGRTWNLEGPGEQRNDFYVKQIIKLATKYNTDLTFFHVVGRYTSLMSTEQLASFENRYQTKIIQPSEAELRIWFAQDAYNDPSHMTLKGSQLFANWVTKEALLP